MRRAAENREAKSISGAEGGELLDRLHRAIVAGAITELAHHASRDIQAELDVGQLPFALGHAQSPRSSEHKDGDHEEQMRDELKGGDEAAKPFAAARVTVVERQHQRMPAPLPFPNAEQHGQDEQEQEEWAGEAHAGSLA